MRRILNTLYINSPDSYLSLDGGTILIRIDDEIKSKVPLLNFEAIVTHGDIGISPALLGECMKRGISVCFMTRSGRFRGRVEGPLKGNVLLVYCSRPRIHGLGQAFHRSYEPHRIMEPYS